jgi:hypothetical protein
MDPAHRYSRLNSREQIMKWSSLEVQRCLGPLLQEALQGHGHKKEASKGRFVVKLALARVEVASAR